jgi:hypothetical protein
MGYRGVGRSLALKTLISACLITAVSLGVSGAFAGSRHAGDLGDQIRKCKAQLAEAQNDLRHAKELEALVARKVTVPPALRKALGADLELPGMILITSGGWGFALTIDVQAQLKLALLNYAQGKLTAKQLSTSLVNLAKFAGRTKRAVADVRREAQHEVDSLRHQCAALIAKQNGTSPAPKPPPPAGTFTLQSPKPTDVSNTHKSELTIDPDGMTAHFDAASGADWQSDYSWKVPQTITAGKTYTITLHDKILNVTPSQPLGDQMNALAPDFAQAIQAHWPDNPDVSKTFTVPLSAGQTSEFTITIGFISSGVTYHYKK